MQGHDLVSKNNKIIFHRAPYTLYSLNLYIYLVSKMVRAKARAKVKQICKQCGKEFEVKPSVLKKGRGRYCSKKCADKGNCGENNSKWRGGKVKRICQTCGEGFLVWRSIITKGNGVFCSKRCRGIKNRKSVILKCEVCGKLIRRAPSRIKLNGNYCSNSCTRKAIKIPKHHTKPERIFEQICKKNNLDFHYVGDGQLWIGKDKVLNPDFIEANGKKICIEIMGIYWHSPLLNKNLREDALQSYREKHYKKYKWQPIFIWDTDLLRKDAEVFVLNELRKNGVLYGG